LAIDISRRTIFINRVTRVTPAGALKIAKAIKEGGNVTATYTLGFHIFK
jgi:hypothetical protein